MLYGQIVPFEQAETVILLDMNNTAYRMAGQRNMAALKTRDGRLSGHVYGIHSTIRSLWSKFGGESTSIVFGWDSPTSKEARLAVMPEYKANRVERRDVFLDMFGEPTAKVFDDIREYTETLPGHTLKSPSVEFDDLAATIIRKNPQKKFVLVSKDKDLWQLIPCGNVVIVGSGGHTVNDADLADSFGLTSFNQVFLFKVLFGDKSDNIPSILPYVKKKEIIWEVIAPLGCTENTSDIVEHLAKSTSKRVQDITKESDFIGKLERNIAMVKFIEIDLDGWLSPFRPGDKGAHDQLLAHYEIKSTRR